MLMKKLSLALIFMSMVVALLMPLTWNFFQSGVSIVTSTSADVVKLLRWHNVAAANRWRAQLGIFAMFMPSQMLLFSSGGCCAGLLVDWLLPDRLGLCDGCSSRGLE
jgi:hypothetical protein